MIKAGLKINSRWNILALCLSRLSVSTPAHPNGHCRRQPVWASVGVHIFPAIKEWRWEFKYPWAWGWGDGSEVKSTCCSCRGPRFSSQRPHGGPQPSVTPVPGDPMPSSDLQFQGTLAPLWRNWHTWSMHTHIRRKCILKKIQGYEVKSDTVYFSALHLSPSFWGNFLESFAS